MRTSERADQRSEETEALRRLANATARPATGVSAPLSPLEQTLAMSARAGREQLADLLHELASACLAADAQCHTPVVTRRSPDLIARELVETARRLHSLGELAGLKGVIDAILAPGAELAAANQCLGLLRDLEGETARVRALRDC